MIAGSGGVNVGGGTGPTAVAPSGRVHYGDAAVGAPVLAHPSLPVAVTTALEFVPRFTSPYFAGLVTPNIVPAISGAPGLAAGPAPFGVLSEFLADPILAAVAADAPPNAVAALIRFDTGPEPLHVACNMSSVTSGTSEFDMIVLLNLTDGAVPVKVNGAPIARMPYTLRAEFGGPGIAEAIVLPAAGSGGSGGPGGAWAVYCPETGVLNLDIEFDGLTHDMTLEDWLDFTTPPPVVYVLSSGCLADFNGSGGTPDDADVAAFFVAWNDGDASADVNSSGGTPDDADVVFFFERWNAGC